MINVEAIASFEDFRREAKKRLPRILFDYIDGGSYSESTLDANVAGFKTLSLEQRIMQDVSSVTSEVSIFGQRYSAPVVLSPVGFAGMYARRGEVQAARAAKQANLPFCLSTVGICSIEEVTERVGLAPWFQLYMIKDRDYVATLLKRAKAAGCPALVITADLQTPGARYRDVRSGMMRKLSLLETLGRGWEGIRKINWSTDVFLRGRPHSFGNLDGVLGENASFAEAWQWISNNFDPSVNWEDLSFIRKHWDGPIVIKGIMTTEDARLAAQRGVDAIVVSNHGGRQLDGAPAAISVLPNIVDAVGKEVDVFFDSGIRSGLDVLKASNIGAKACLIGRPWAFALSAAGQAGVKRLLDIMLAELHTAQTLSSIKSL